MIFMIYAAGVREGLSTLAEFVSGILEERNGKNEKD